MSSSTIMSKVFTLSSILLFIAITTTSITEAFVTSPSTFSPSKYTTSTMRRRRSISGSTLTPKEERHINEMINIRSKKYSRPLQMGAVPSSSPSLSDRRYIDEIEGKVQNAFRGHDKRDRLETTEEWRLASCMLNQQ